MLQKRCLIVDDIHTNLISKLEDMGMEVEYAPEITRKDILVKIKEYHGLVIRSKTPVDQELLNAASQLEFIGRAGAGLDQIDVAVAHEKNITLINAPEGNRDALAEHCIALLLGLFNKIYQGQHQIRHGIWAREENRGIELHNKTVGIVGFGFMGEAFAKRLTGFGCNIMAYDKYKHGFSNKYIQEVTLDELKIHADIVSFHVPLTKETDGMVDAGYIGEFHKNIYILNTARGELMPLDMLKVQLEQGKVLGAALDVHEYEKKVHLSPHEQTIFHYYKSADNVLLTPHVAGWTIESYRKISDVLFSKISQFYHAKIS